MNRLVVAGMPYLHRAAPPVLPPAPFVTDWCGSRVDDEPLSVLHTVGPTSAEGLRLLVETALPQGNYYLDSSDNIAVRFPGDPSSGFRPQLLRTVRRGFEYELFYEHAEDVPLLQREWHRTLLMLALPMRSRGLVFHAAGVVFPDGIGIISPGASGAGKSTLVRTLTALGPDMTALSDDRIALTGLGDTLRIWGTPWHSAAHAASPVDVPCRATLFVAHGTSAGTRLKGLSPADATRRILKTAAIPFWESAGTDFALSLIDELVSRVPTFECSYVPSPGAGRSLVRELAQALS